MNSNDKMPISSVNHLNTRLSNTTFMTINMQYVAESNDLKNNKVQNMAFFSINSESCVETDLYTFVKCRLIHLSVGSGKTEGTAQDPDSLHPIHCTLNNTALIYHRSTPPKIVYDNILMHFVTCKILQSLHPCEHISLPLFLQMHRAYSRLCIIRQLYHHFILCYIIELNLA